MRRLLPFALLIGLAACGGLRLEEFENTEPRFALEDYFLGHTRVWGAFYDRFGNLRRQFVADIEGTFDGEVLTMDEVFLFDDGEREERVWEFTRLGEGRWEGRAADVVGLASVASAGRAVHLRYDLELPVGERTWVVHFDDWLLLQPGEVVINRAQVTKFGVRIGEMVAFFAKVDEDEAGGAGS